MTAQVFFVDLFTKSKRRISSVKEPLCNVATGEHDCEQFNLVDTSVNEIITMGKHGEYNHWVAKKSLHSKDTDSNPVFGPTWESH